MTGTIRSGSASFVPRARLIKLLGGELIRDEVMAVVELVKNAHDADASFVRLYFKLASETPGCIEIEDDGHGMDVENLLENWMQPAGSSKRERAHHYTVGGRRVLGEKGVGRFAIDRLGRFTHLVSRRPGNDTEFVARFDWDEFDDDSRLLSDVHSRWEERKADRIVRSGTLIRIEELRSAWTERSFRKLCARLQRLLSPLRESQNFRIEIISDEFPDYSCTLKTDLIDLSPYRTAASFDGQETVRISMNGGDASEHLWNGAGRLSCGPVRLTLHAFDLEVDALSQIGPRQEVRAWLREWSGVSVYRDGFRVLPYGEPDDDWLRLDQRRVNNPVVRLSNNQICGFIEITQDQNPELRDQTNRGGLIQNRAFEDLRRLVLFVMQLLEADRQLKRHPASDDDRPLEKDDDLTHGTLLDSMESLARDIRGGTGRELLKLVGDLKSTIAREQERQNADLLEFAQLAAIGQSAAFLNHSIEPHLRVLGEGLSELLERRSGEGDAERRFIIRDMNDSLSEMIDAIGLLGQVAPTGHTRRRVIDVNDQLHVFRKTTSQFLSDHNINLEVAKGNGRLSRADIPPENLQQVLHMLLWNSIDWMDPQEPGRIRVFASRSDKYCGILYQDNGPGVSHNISEKIFLSGFSMKENGRGMGLPMVRQLLSRYGASIRLLTDRRRKGANFEILLRVRNSRSMMNLP